MPTLFLQFADITVLVNAEPRSAELLTTNYSGMLCDGNTSSCHLAYQVDHLESGYTITRADELVLESGNASELIYAFEKDLTIQLQKQRPDLYFMHGAALQLGDNTILVTGRSGAGKSTTTWALTHHGFAYLSDELAPIDLNSMQVQPYPHALCLKHQPPEPYSLPTATLVTEYTMHVPTGHLNGGIRNQAQRLTHVFFINYNPEQKAVVLNRLNSAHASMLIYSNALNHLCHADAGLPAATQIARTCQCMELEFSDAYQACLAIRECLKLEHAA